MWRHFRLSGSSYHLVQYHSGYINNQHIYSTQYNSICEEANQERTRRPVANNSPRRTETRSHLQSRRRAVLLGRVQGGPG